MLTTLQAILSQSWNRLGDQVQALLPNLLAMLLMLAGGWIVARLAQWALERTGTRMQNRLRLWGFAGGASHTVARAAFWVIFGCAILMGINALNTQLGSLLATSAFLYLPRIVTAAFVFLGGLLLARFLARGALIWAVNEGIGAARLIAGGVRIGVISLASVGAMEQLGVARSAVLATFIILLAGTVLAAALAIGLGSRRRVEHWLDSRAALLEENEAEQEKIQHL